MSGWAEGDTSGDEPKKIRLGVREREADVGHWIQIQGPQIRLLIEEKKTLGPFFVSKLNSQ